MSHEFDGVLLSRARLGIVTVLMTRPEATFPELKSLLGLTQGNLGVHLKKLEEEGYVEVTKAFVERKPRTTARLTAKGRDAFLAHVAHLERIARDGRH
ncbi:MAG: transcriptional regulator [Planctomycetota bacterium]